MKKILAGLLMGAALVSGSSAFADDCKVGVSVYTLNSRFMAALQQAAIAKAQALGCEVVSTDAQNDLTKQISDVEDLLAGGVNVLVIDPYNQGGLVATVNNAAAQGIPVVVMDNTMDASAKFVTMVQSSNIKNGTLVGEWVAKKMGDTPMKIALLSGQEGSGAGLERRSGLLLGISEEQLRSLGKTNYEIVAQRYTDWTSDAGLRAMEDILTAHPDVNVVLSEADIINFGAMRVLDEKGKNDVLVAAAADGQKEAYAFIKEGKYGATGLNDPTLVANTAVEIAVKAFRKELGDGVQKLTLTEPAAVHAENVDEYYNPDSVF